jgi:hypothetical protein
MTENDYPPLRRKMYIVAILVAWALGLMLIMEACLRAAEG